MFMIQDEYTVPDSTTMIDRPQYLEGEDILLHDKDGFIYLGTIVQVCYSATILPVSKPIQNFF